MLLFVIVVELQFTEHCWLFTLVGVTVEVSSRIGIKEAIRRKTETRPDYRHDGPVF
jgi:hypothetical protein